MENGTQPKHAKKNKSLQHWLCHTLHNIYAILHGFLAQFLHE